MRALQIELRFFFEPSIFRETDICAHFSHLSNVLDISAPSMVNFDTWAIQDKLRFGSLKSVGRMGWKAYVSTTVQRVPGLRVGQDM